MRLFNGKSFIGLLIFIILFSCSSRLSSQEYKIGFEAGPNLSKGRVTGAPDSLGGVRYNKILLSYHLNGFFAFKSKGFMGISATPGLNIKGTSYSSVNGNKNDRLSLYYFHFPVMADFYLTKKLEFSIGPDPAVLLHASARIDGTRGGVTDWYERFEMSAIAGFSYRINNTISAGIRYSHAFSWFDELIITDTSGENVIHLHEYNHTLMFSIRFAW